MKEERNAEFSVPLFFCARSQFQHDMDICMIVCFMPMMFVIGNRVEVLPGVMTSYMMSFVPAVVMISVMVPFVGNVPRMMGPRRRSRFSCGCHSYAEEQNRSKDNCRRQIQPFFHKCHRLSFMASL